MVPFLCVSANFANKDGWKFISLQSTKVSDLEVINLPPASLFLFIFISQFCSKHTSEINSLDQWLSVEDIWEER